MTDNQNTTTEVTYRNNVRKYNPASQNRYVDDKVLVNVCGTVFETTEKTLSRFPNTLLGDPAKRMLYYDRYLDQFYFDRNRSAFEAVLFFYQSNGTLFRPLHIPVDVFVQELKFFKIDDASIKKLLLDEGFVEFETPKLEKPNLKETIWITLEHPEYSIAARIVSIVSLIVIVVSIVAFCLETLPQFRRGPLDQFIYTNNTPANLSKIILASQDTVLHQPWFAIESSCIAYFTVEFFIRLGCAPSKVQFMKSLPNIFDMISFIPFYITLPIYYTKFSNLGFLRAIRLVRVFRVLKLTRHSKGLQVLGLTLRSSLRELGLLIFFLFTGVILFSSAIFYAEGNEKNSVFESIPDAFWWAVVTMTTVGYGDKVPKTGWGKFIGGLCAICGVLTIALPVPVIVSNFNYYYHRDDVLQADEPVGLKREESVRSGGPPARKRSLARRPSTMSFSEFKMVYKEPSSIE